MVGWPSSKMTRFGIFLCVIAAFLGSARRALAGPFEVRDTGWEGCSELFELARAELGESRVAWLSPSSIGSNFGPKTDSSSCTRAARSPSDRLSKFLRAGGRVAVIDDFGAGSRILERFGIERVRIPAPAADDPPPQGRSCHRGAGARADGGAG